MRCDSDAVTSEAPGNDAVPVRRRIMVYREPAHFVVEYTVPSQGGLERSILEHQLFITR